MLKDYTLNNIQYIAEQTKTQPSTIWREYSEAYTAIVGGLEVLVEQKNLTLKDAGNMGRYQRFQEIMCKEAFKVLYNKYHLEMGDIYTTNGIVKK